MPAPTPITSGTFRTDSELSEFLLRECHDLRGPLRTAKIYAELLAKGSAGQDDDSKQSLAFVVSGVAGAAAVLDGVADYALALAIDASHFQAVPMDVMVRAAMARLAAPIRTSEATVSYDQLPSVLGDADRVLQLIEYLVDRALRAAGPNPPRIRISAEEQDGAWLFTVRDNAGGLGAESLEAIFKPFARMHANQRPGPGLAVCRVIVERHGGKMWAEADPGDGCVFRFILPVA